MLIQQLFTEHIITTKISNLHTCMHACMHDQSFLTPCNPIDCSPPASSVHGILQSRILEWVAMPSSRESSRPRDGTRSFCIGRSNLQSPSNLHTQMKFKRWAQNRCRCGLTSLFYTDEHNFKFPVPLGWQSITSQLV